MICSKIDGELADDQRGALEDHLATCQTCRDTAETLFLQDAQLRRAFAPCRRRAADVAEGVIAQLPASAITRRSFWTAWSPLLAAAAGFAIALMIFQPWKTPARLPPLVIPATNPTPAPAPIGQLALATGRVEARAPGSTQWHAMESGGAVTPGTAIRTGPKIRCEFKMTDGSEVRLNADTQVTLKGPRQVELAGGQVFSTVAKAKDAADPFVVRGAPADVAMVALGTAFDFRCPSDGGKATLTVVEGSVKVQARSGDQVVKAGQALDLSGGRFGELREVQNLMRATQWVDEILVLKGRDNQELARRMDDLFAQLGEGKMNFMAEEEIRRLGDHCVIPLTRYIQSERSRGRDPSRHAAARIVADVATTWAIPELINLLADRDGEVRYHASRALARLTNNQLGPPQDWRDQSLTQCMPRIDRWHQWWEQNKARFPGCDPDAVKPVARDTTAPEVKGKG